MFQSCFLYISKIWSKFRTGSNFYDFWFSSEIQKFCTRLYRLKSVQRSGPAVHGSDINFCYYDMDLPSCFIFGSFLQVEIILGHVPNLSRHPWPATVIATKLVLKSFILKMLQPLIFSLKRKKMGRGSRTSDLLWRKILVMKGDDRL